MSSGILSQDCGDSDVSAVLTVADEVCTWWNKTQAPTYGISFLVSESKVLACGATAQALFNSGIFPENPGPFKRVAALLILGRLTPFFILKNGFYDEQNNWVPNSEPVQSGEEEMAWLTRMLILCIPVTLSRLECDLNGTKITLDEWNAFPSPHYKLEFMGWLRWLDGYSNLKGKLGSDWDKFNGERLARMVMSTSLMLEACYYVDQNHKILSHGYCGLKPLDEDMRLDLYYDIPHPRSPTNKPEPLN